MGLISVTSTLKCTLKIFETEVFDCKDLSIGYFEQKVKPTGQRKHLECYQTMNYTNSSLYKLKPLVAKYLLLY